MATKIHSVVLSMPLAIEATERIGTAITWDAWGISVSRTSLLSAVRAHCPAFEVLVPEQGEPAAAMTRAISRRQHAHSENDWRWEPIADDDKAAPGTRRIALAQASRDAGTFSAGTLLTLHLNKATGDCSVQPTPAQGSDEARAVDALLTRYAVERDTLTASKVTGPSGFLRKVLEQLDALKISTTQAQYLVTAPKDAAMEGVEQALKVAGVAIIPIPVLPAGARALGAAVTRGLSEEVAALEAEVAARLQRVRDGGGVREDTVLADIAAVRQLRERAGLYHTALEVNAVQVNEALLDVEAAITETENLLAARAAQQLSL